MRVSRRMWPAATVLVVLALVFATLPLSTTTVVSAALALFVWGIAGSLVFIPQQHRLLGLAPQHANVILALNNSTLYLGIAGGAALGGVVLQTAPVRSLGWIGTTFVVMALLTLLLSVRVSIRPRSSEQASRLSHEPGAKSCLP